MHYAIGIGKQLLGQIGVDQSHLLLAGPTAAGTGLHSSRLIHDAKAAALRADKLQSADAPWRSVRRTANVDRALQPSSAMSISSVVTRWSLVALSMT